MKYISYMLLAICIISGGLLFCLHQYGDGGADGLSLFIPGLMLIIILLCSLIGFIITLFLPLIAKRHRSKVAIFAAITPIIAIAIIATTFYSFNAEYATRIEEDIAIEKSILTTELFSSDIMGIKFHHVSGNVSGSDGGVPIVDTIVPIVKDSTLHFTKNGEILTLSDQVFFIDKNHNQDLEDFLANGLKKLFDEDNCMPKKIKVSKVFKNLDPTLDVFVLSSSSKCNYKKVSSFVSQYTDQTNDSYQQAYFIEVPHKKDKILVITQHNTSSSIDGYVEKLSANNLRKKNKWYHSLEFEKQK
ncbi:hypothetical protein [Aquimarina algicola]|uniref:Uncharacterized protein n=1 Tax=Aquimarina algicola TaxID=2589995 RepID=A0A504J7A0_9FLAO|nr:hypothetical protein [Aquimarina algicola]TPN82979.1 hypothetical protein FHK87_21370 [Aquimarina algicola]